MTLEKCAAGFVGLGGRRPNTLGQAKSKKKHSNTRIASLRKDRRCAAVVHRFFNASRMSVSNCTSLDGAAGAGGGSAVFSRFIPLMTRNNTKAMIRKLRTMVRKFPHARTAPCFFASASAVAVTFDDSAE